MSGFKKEDFDSSLNDAPAGSTSKEKKTKDRPTGLRILNQSNDLEAAAAAAGFKFVDAAENVYTLQEAKENKWV